MIDLAICSGCPRCKEYFPSLCDEDGKIIALPSIHCENTDEILIGNSELPDGCPYILEQKLLEDRAFDNFEDLKEDQEDI